MAKSATSGKWSEATRVKRSRGTRILSGTKNSAEVKMWSIRAKGWVELKRAQRGGPFRAGWHPRRRWAASR